MAKLNTHECVKRERKTRFVEIFRTTPVETVCPNFYVLSHANGCTFSPQCSYCYLKSSLWHVGGQQAFTNVDRMIAEVRAWIAQDDLESYVLNTGNLSDSLVFEQVRPLIPELVETFRTDAQAKGRPHVLLLVTKGGVQECQPLLQAQPCANVVVSFSINSPQAAGQYEQGAADPADRLEAARQLKAKGWRVRIRIDPMILGFDYTWTIEQVRQLHPERVTLGTLRAEANLERFVEDGLFDQLEQPANPKAMARYPRPARMALYSQAAKALKPICPVALCEETPDVWDELGLDKDGRECNCGS